MRKFFTMLPAWAAALLLCVSPATAAYKITFDPGGSVFEFIQKYVAINDVEGKVVIDGACISACTLVTALVDDNRVCITPRARLAFHSAWFEGEDGKPQFAAEATKLIFTMYPEKVRELLRTKGWDGNTEHPDLIWIEGAELQSIYKDCTPPAAS